MGGTETEGREEKEGEAFGGASQFAKVPPPQGPITHSIKSIKKAWSEGSACGREEVVLVPNKEVLVNKGLCITI